MPSSNKTKTISTRVHLARDIHGRALAHAATHQMPMAALLRQALVAYLEAQEGAGAKASLAASSQAVVDIEKGLDRVRAEVVRLGDQMARLRQGGSSDS